MLKGETVSDVIRITGLALHGYHGVFDEEKRDGQTFVVDLAIDLDGATAGTTDSLHHTVDYSQVVEAVAGAVTGESVDLIETLAYRVGDIVVGFDGVRAVEVTIHKPDAPVGYPVTDISFSTRVVKG
jgi:dihydroneopterin aldolase